MGNCKTLFLLNSINKNGVNIEEAAIDPNIYQTSITNSNSLHANEIHGNGGSGKMNDTGFLRLSAGGGTNTSNKSYIDLYGYNCNSIVFGTKGSERMSISAGGNVTFKQSIYMDGNLFLIKYKCREKSN